MAELQTGPHEVDVEHIMLKGPDGTAVDAIHARPDGMPASGLVVHPDIMGVRPLFDDLCRRLATHGFAVCAPEPFVRAPVEVRGDADSNARMDYVKPAGISVSVSGDDEPKLEGFWNALVDGGSVVMPFEVPPWGGRFGMLRDKFGIDWMVSYSPEP